MSLARRIERLEQTRPQKAPFHPDFWLAMWGMCEPSPGMQKILEELECPLKSDDAIEWLIANPDPPQPRGRSNNTSSGVQLD